jgi:hypothetical protein
VVLLHVAPEIIEDTNEVAIKIGGYKLAQLPDTTLFPVTCLGYSFSDGGFVGSGGWLYLGAASVVASPGTGS